MPENTLIGKTIENYRIERLLGQGGMAAVYEATDLKLQRSIAIKLMHPHLASQKNFQERFLQEGQAAASLDHPNIVRVLYLGGSDDGDLYIVMELISGGNLRKYIKRLSQQGITMGYPEAIEIVRQIATALDYAHDRNMVHRDLKPDNIVLKPDTSTTPRLNYRPILTDFGLAVLISNIKEEIATEQQPIGTYPYMSPEQCNGQEVDRRTDIYALGVMLYELTVGRLPFNPSTLSEAARMHGYEQYILPSQLYPGFPKELEQIIVRSLQKEPRNRYQNAGQLAADLKALQKPVEFASKGFDTSIEASMDTQDQLVTQLATAVMNHPLAIFPPFDPPARTEEEEEQDSVVIYSVEGANTYILENDVTTLGSDDDRDIVLPGVNTSRRHLRLERKPNGTYYIIDEGSLNGTYVEDDKLTAGNPAILRPYVTVRMGDYWMQLRPQIVPDVSEEEIAEDDVNEMLSSAYSEIGTGMDTQLYGIPPAEARPDMTPPQLTALQIATDRLIIFHKDSTPEIILLERNEYTLGRTSHQDISLESDKVSRRHARIQERNGTFYIADLGSTNGTWIENERLERNRRYEMPNGRVIRIGDYWLKFEIKQDITLSGPIGATTDEEYDDKLDTVRMVKPLDESMPHYSPPPLSPEVRSRDRLVFFSDDHPMRILPLEKEITTIGRRSGQDIQLSGKRVSREHAILEARADGNLYITDLDSRNGIWVGDTLLVPNTRVLWPKHEIVRLGNYWIRFERGTDDLGLAGGRSQDTRGLIGKTIGNYRIDRFIGDNPMASLYKATDLSLDRDVALRILLPHLAQEPSIKQRFLEEARIVSRLDHPNIVKVLSYNTIGKEVFMVHDLVKGGSLRQLMRTYEDRGEQMEISDAVEMVRQLANGLHYAHQQGLIHRDITPDNIVLKSTTVVGPIQSHQPILTDFSLARFSEAGDIFDGDAGDDSFPYMSPEQCLGERTDFRSDIYESSIVLYELLLGRPPFSPHSIAEAVRMHARESVPSLVDARPEIPVELEAVVMRGLAKTPNDRYQTAGEMGRALQRVLTIITEESEGDLYAGIPSFDTEVMDESTPLEVPMRTEPPLPEGEVKYDRLIMFSELYPTKHIDLNKSVITIGSGEDQDVVLSSKRVSRRHARIERTADNQYRIVDIGSLNGSWLGHYRLLNNVPEAWDPVQTVRVGDYWLRIEKKDYLAKRKEAPKLPKSDPFADDEYITDAKGEKPQGGERVQHPPPLHDRIGVEVTPTRMTTAPGNPVTLAIEVVNQSNFVDHFGVEVVGLPAGWVTKQGEELYLLPYNRETTHVTLLPPMVSTSSAGEHAFEIHVSSRAKRINAVRTQCSLEVEPFTAFVSDLYPERLKRPSFTELTISNTGNTHVTFNIVARDMENALQFELEGRQYLLPPGYQETVQVHIEPRRRPWFGQLQVFPYEVLVMPVPGDAGGGAQTLFGEMQVRPRFSRWIFALLLIPLLLIACASFFAYTEYTRVRDIQGTETAVAFIGSAAATETAVALADDDGDGLTNLKEIELGTFPDLADTDEDGLSDSVEVRVWLTNPLNRDTDGDTLTDGAEVAMGTDPLLRDTDGDGIPDNEDAFPSTMATPTASPYPTIPGSLGDICPGSPIPSRIAVGMQAFVEDGGVANRVREAPTKESEILGYLDPGAVFIVLSGPVCDQEEQVRWWEIDADGLVGWTAEGEGEEYYIAPPGAEDPAGGDTESADETEANLPAPGTVALDRSKMGIQVYNNVSEQEWTSLISYAQPMNMGWVKLQANWSFLQPQSADQVGENLNNFVRQVINADAQGYKVMVSVAKAPHWARGITDLDGPPDDPKALADFIELLFDLTGNSIDAVEVWNEPNILREWSTTAYEFSGSGYMELFTPVYERIKAIAPGVRVITAGLAPTTTTAVSVNDRTFLRQMYGEDLDEFAGVAIGIHPYGWGNSPDTICCDPVEGRGWDDQAQFFFINNLVDYRNIMSRYRHLKAKLWVTEFGWTTWEDLGSNPPEPWMNYVSTEQQSQYTMRAFEIGQSLDYVDVMFLWNFNYANSSTVTAQNEIAGYSVLYTDENRNLHTREVYRALSGTSP